MLNSALLPPIRITIDDHQALERLTRASSETAQYLAREIERARVIHRRPDNADFVRMGSHVAFRDDVTEEVHRVVLVYPDEADISARKISVLTPVGAALIGLSKGQSIDWRTPAGDWRLLTVLSVGEGAEEQMSATQSQAT